jgi:hypothetical protein
VHSFSKKVNMSLGWSYVIRTDTTIITLAYAPVLLERKAIRIRKDIDQEKASHVVIRISVDIADKKCVILSLCYYMLICHVDGRPYSAELSFVLSGCSYTSLSCNSSDSTWPLYMVSFIVCDQNLLNRMPPYPFQYSSRQYLRSSKMCIMTE